MHSWRDSILRPHHFISRWVRCLSDNVLCLLHLPIRRKVLDHERINKDEAIEMMVDYLRVYPTDGMAEMDITRWDHARFKFLKKVYANEL